MAKFLSKCANQVLCMIPNRVQIADGGIPVVTPGKAIRFVSGEYDTEDKKEIKYIREHAFFGFNITEIEEEKPEIKK